MIKRILFILIILSGNIFAHYYNKHKILSYARQTQKLVEKYNSQKNINLNLVTQNSKLSSRERIQKLAFDELDMFYPGNNYSVHNIKINTKKETFCLIDYIIPSVEALTK